jgi:phosphohistidine phosphatase SixA
LRHLAVPSSWRVDLLTFNLVAAATLVGAHAFSLLKSLIVLNCDALDCSSAATAAATVGDGAKVCAGGIMEWRPREHPSRCMNSCARSGNEGNSTHLQVVWHSHLPVVSSLVLAAHPSLHTVMKNRRPHVVPTSFVVVFGFCECHPAPKVLALESSCHTRIGKHGNTTAVHVPLSSASATTREGGGALSRAPVCIRVPYALECMHACKQTFIVHASFIASILPLFTK